MPYARPYRTTAKGRKSRGSVMRRYKKKPKAGLNKTEVKQTTTIAKKVVKSLAESKYYECISMSNLNSDSGGVIGAGKQLVASGVYATPNHRVRVLGYCTTNIIVGDSIIDQYNYGVGNTAIAPTSMVNLEMARRYIDNGATPPKPHSGS